jgi:hypothetical protein
VPTQPPQPQRPAAAFCHFDSCHEVTFFPSKRHTVQRPPLITGAQPPAPHLELVGVVDNFFPHRHVVVMIDNIFFYADDAAFWFVFPVLFPESHCTYVQT